MILAHIFLPAMLLVICRSQQTPAHLTNIYGNEENVYDNVSPESDTISTSTTTSNDELLDRYRQLTAKSLLRLYDSCKVHDFLQNLKHNIENDIGKKSFNASAYMMKTDGLSPIFPTKNELGDEESVKTSGMGKDHQQRYINTLLRMLEKQQAFDNDASLLFPNERPKSALMHYITISMLLQDKELDETLNFMLYDKCCKNDVNIFCTRNVDDSNPEKRNTIKKVKFHSWGGKRSSQRSGQTNVRMPTNVDLSKDLGQTKIVIRAPFRPWGGRRK